MDHDDGYLQNTIEIRDELIGLIRLFRPDVIVTHRTNDYHTDHRNTGLLVQDASFLLRVPLICPKSPALDYEPVILYMGDGFKKPLQMQPDMVMDTEEYLNDKFSQDESINAISAFVDWKALAMHERNTYGKLDLTYNNIGYDGQWLYR